MHTVNITSGTVRAPKTCALLGLLLVSACGGKPTNGPGDNRDTPASVAPVKDLGTRPLAAPKFEYQPGPPGRAVGIRALVQVQGVELESNEVELDLIDA